MKQKLSHCIGVALAFMVSVAFARSADAICSINDPERYACMDLQNKSERYVTAYWDDNYGCNTAPGTTCSFIVPVENHTFTYRSNDGVSGNFGTGYVGPGCCDDAHRLVVWDE